MTKLVVLAAAMVGTLFALNTWFPSTWTSVVHIPGVKNLVIPYAYFILGGMFALGVRLRPSK